MVTTHLFKKRPITGLESFEHMNIQTLEVADLQGGKWIPGKCNGLGAQLMDLLLTQPSDSEEVAQDTIL